jgi:hypothetical protein
MNVAGQEKQHGKNTARAVFFPYATAALLFCLLTAFLYVRRGWMHSLFDLPFYVGATSWELIADGRICFASFSTGHLMWMSAARMPVATLYATAAVLYLGPFQLLSATLIKAALFLLPVLGAARVVLYRSANSKGRLLFCVTVLSLPFLVPNFLADVVNLQVEEGFAYAFIAIAFTLVALGVRADIADIPASLRFTLATAAALDMLYLSKSSMILVVFVLVLFSLWRNGPRWSRLLLLLLVAAAPLGWAMRQHAVSGRYAVGTSYDGVNFHKGNNALFLVHYPPADGSNLDAYDYQLHPPHPLEGEWAYNDWHNREAILFIRTHPYATLRGWQKKAYVFLISTHEYGNGSVSAPAPVTAVGMVLFRLLLLGAIVLSAVVLFRGRGRQRETAALYLATVAACTVPYLAGFGYTRHASVLVYPSAIAICLLCGPWFRPDGLPGRR